MHRYEKAREIYCRRLLDPFTQNREHRSIETEPERKKHRYESEPRQSSAKVFIIEKHIAEAFADVSPILETVNRAAGSMIPDPTDSQRPRQRHDEPGRGVRKHLSAFYTLNSKPSSCLLYCVVRRILIAFAPEAVQL